MLGLWRDCRPPPGRIGGMAAGIIPAATHLPESGGAGEQVAIVMDALEIMTQAELALSMPGAETGALE